MKSMIMNKIMRLIGLLFLLSIVASCNKAPEYYTLETPADQMLLKTSSTQLVLEKEKENQPAVTFTWNAAAQRGGADATITYFFRMYMSDLHSNVTEAYEITPEERSFSFTHKELNDILASWNILPGDNITVEAEVIAQVDSPVQYVKPELSKVELDVTGYDKNATAIYMVMMTEDGERATRRMTEKVVGSGIYQSTSELKPCKYFFTLSAESDYPRYMKGGDGDNSLQYVTEEGGDYEMLENTLAGPYEVIVGLNATNIVRIIPKMLELPNNGIWIIGGGCAAVGWDVAGAYKRGVMTNNDPLYPERWTYTGSFKTPDGENNDSGAFKLLAGTEAEGYGGDSFFAPEEWANPVQKHTLEPLRKGGNDWKWRVPATGTYTLVVDLSAMTISLNPVE